MPTTLYRRCEWCTGGCDQCRMTGFVELLATKEQIQAALDRVPEAAELKADLSILKAHNAAYAAENARLRAIINEGRHAGE
jgi:hypothetical protein